MNKEQVHYTNNQQNKQNTSYNTIKQNFPQV